LTLKSDSYGQARENGILKAVRSGALSRYEVKLERGEQYGRRLWLRPNVLGKLSNLDQDQLDRVRAALRRFVIGGRFNVVSKNCANPGALNVADIRELKTSPPPFIEMRFKPPKHHLRLFGRFIGKDGLILSSMALKSSASEKGAKSLSVPTELKRCEDFFKSQAFDPDWIPESIEESLSNANII
jgi:hypothetical protein